MTDTRIQTTGYAVLNENDPNQKYTSARKTYADNAYGSKISTPSKIKISIYAENFLLGL